MNVPRASVTQSELCIECSCALIAYRRCYKRPLTYCRELKLKNKRWESVCWRRMASSDQTSWGSEETA